MHITPGGRAATTEGRRGGICQTRSGQARTVATIRQQGFGLNSSGSQLNSNNTLIMGIYLIKTKNSSLGSSIRQQRNSIRRQSSN